MRFDEGMNELPHNLIPPNQRDLEQAEQGVKFPAEPTEVDTDNEFQFFVYPFAQMEKRTMNVLPTCTSQNFDLKIELDPIYGRAYVLDVETKSSAAKLYSSAKATPKAI